MVLSLALSCKERKKELYQAKARLTTNKSSSPEPFGPSQTQPHTQKIPASASSAGEPPRDRQRPKTASGRGVTTPSPFSLPILAVFLQYMLCHQISYLYLIHADADSDSDSARMLATDMTREQPRSFCRRSPDCLVPLDFVSSWPGCLAAM